MNFPWRILFALLIGAALHTGNAQEKDEPEVPHEADPEVGSPLGGLIIAKGIKKLALFEGIKKIKLKLSKLGLKKGLFLAKIPWLASPNPNADGGENMDGSDTFYIGIPDEVGAHMWNGQNFDVDFHPEFERVKVEDSHDWHNHLRYQQDPHERSVHESEFISAYTEGHPMTEIYRFIEEPQKPFPYYNHHFRETYHDVDPFEQEGQESRYYVTSVRDPNESKHSKLSSNIPVSEPSAQMQQIQYTEYSPQTMTQNVGEKSNLKNDKYHVLRKEPQASELNSKQMPVLYTPADDKNIQLDVTTMPGQDTSNGQKNQEAQAPMYVWHAPTNIPMQVTQQEQLNQEVQTPIGVWKPQKIEDTQPQIVLWRPEAAVNTPNSGNGKEESNLPPMIMQEFMQPMQSFSQAKSSSAHDKYSEDNLQNVQMAERNSAIMTPEYVTKTGYEASLVQQPNWTLMKVGASQEKDINVEQSYAYPVKKIKSEIDVSSRISMEGAGIKKRQMVSSTCGSSTFTDPFARFAEVSQTAEGSKTTEPILSNQGQTENQSEYLNQQTKPTFEQQQMLNNQKLSQASIGGKAMTQVQEQSYYKLGPDQIMYQQLSGNPRIADDQTPHVVIDNQPLSAVILPSDGQATAEMMPDQPAFRTSHAIIPSQSQQEQGAQFQYQIPTSQNFYNSETQQYSEIPSPQYAQYRFQNENLDVPAHQDNAGEVGQDDKSYDMQRNEEAENPSESELGHMEPQTPEHARTFHKKLLFGLKNNHGHKSTHYHYHTHSGYGGHGYGGHGYGSYGHGSYGHGGHGYYSHGYGYVGQTNPSSHSQQQETIPKQENQDSQISPISSNMELMPSASNNEPQIVKPEEPSCPCARSWNEGYPLYHNDRRLENSSKLRRKRNISRSPYLPQNQAQCVQAAVRLSERLVEPLSQRQVCSNGQFQHNSVSEAYQTYSSYPNMESVVEPYSSQSYYKSEPSLNYFPLNQGYKELTIDSNDPSKVDQEIYKKIMEHTEQSVKEALAKASAEPLQINGDQIVADGEELKQDPEIVQAPSYASEGNSPIINVAPEQSLSAADILPAPSEKSVASYLPQDMPMSSYQYQNQYSNSLEKSPPFGVLSGFGRSYKPQIDPLEALKVFDMASTSGTTFHQLLDAIKVKLFACCEKCKDKILRGIHEKIEEEERDQLPRHGHRDESHEFYPSKNMKDIYKEVETLSRDVWTDELANSWENKGRRGSTKDKKSLSEKKQRLKKLAQYLLEFKKCKCNSHESVEQYSSSETGTSGEQCSFEITSTRKVNKSQKQAGKEVRPRLRKTKNLGSHKGSRRHGRKKQKSANLDEQTSISSLNDF